MQVSMPTSGKWHAELIRKYADREEDRDDREEAGGEAGRE